MINSLSRGLQILRLLADANRSLGVTDIAGRLEVDPSTSYRLLATLEKHGFIRQESTKKYRLGFGVVEIASALIGQIDVVAVATPHLHALMITTGESTHLAVADGVRAVFVAQKRAPGTLHVDTPVGSGEPLYCTAVGKALLAETAAAGLRALFRETALPRYSPNTLTTLDQLSAELQRTRDRGYAFDDEELHAGVRCVAVAVRDHTGTIVAALGVSAPASRLTRDRQAEFAIAVQRAGLDVSAELGFRDVPRIDVAAAT